MTDITEQRNADYYVSGVTHDYSTEYRALTRVSDDDAEFFVVYEKSPDGETGVCTTWERSWADRIALVLQALDGLPDLALEGGWTARGASQHAAELEDKLAQRDAQIAEQEQELVRAKELHSEYWHNMRAAQMRANTAESQNSELRAQIAALTAENEYIRNRFKEVDLIFGKNLLVMRAAIIEWQATGNAKKGLAWIYNTLWGPGELPDENEKEAQAYFDREYAPIDKELMALHQWFGEQHQRDTELREGK